MLGKFQWNFYSFTLVSHLYKTGRSRTNSIHFSFVVINLFSFKSTCSNWGARCKLLLRKPSQPKVPVEGNTNTQDRLSRSGNCQKPPERAVCLHTMAHASRALQRSQDHTRMLHITPDCSTAVENISSLMKTPKSTHLTLLCPSAEQVIYTSLLQFMYLGHLFSFYYFWPWLPHSFTDQETAFPCC